MGYYQSGVEFSGFAKVRDRAFVHCRLICGDTSIHFAGTSLGVDGMNQRQSQNAKRDGSTHGVCLCHKDTESYSKVPRKTDGKLMLRSTSEEKQIPRGAKARS